MLRKIPAIQQIKNKKGALMLEFDETSHFSYPIREIYHHLPSTRKNPWLVNLQSLEKKILSLEVKKLHQTKSKLQGNTCLTVNEKRGYLLATNISKRYFFYFKKDYFFIKLIL